MTPAGYLKQWRHIGLVLLLLAYISLSVALSAEIPLSKAPDEYVHFLYSRFLAEHGRPPVNAQERQIAGYKSDQPPLYHALVALLTSGIDVSEPPKFKFTWEPHQRQLIDIVLPRAILVRTEDETWPYAGLFLAWFVGRWFSIMLSAATLAVTYFIALELLPNHYRVALAASATLAFLPRYIFTGSVLSDDNLIGLLMALFLWVVVRLIKNPMLGLGWFAALGILAGLALITKYSVALVPLELTLLLIWLARKQPQPWRYGLSRLGVSSLAMVVVVAVWFGFIILNFNQIKELGPILGIINPFIAGDISDETSALISGFITGNRDLLAEADPGAPEGNLLAWGQFLFEQLWDVPVFGSPRLYPALVVVLPALIVCLLAIFGLWRCWQEGPGQQRRWLIALPVHFFIFIPIPLLRFVLTGQIHDTAQARHLLFPAAPALAILLVMGLLAVFPSKWRPQASLILPTFTFSLTLLHLYYYSFAFPTPLPVRTDPSLAGTPEQPLGVEFVDGLRLQGYAGGVKDDHLLVLELYWRLVSPAHEDYRTEISLYDSQDQLQRSWLSHPAGGRFPTRAWDVGDSVRDTLAIPLVGLSPGSYRVRLRLLDWDDRPLSSESGDSVDVMICDLVSPPQLQAPALWQVGPTTGHPPLYRYRATIPLLAPAGKRANLVGPDEQIYSHVADAGGLSLFMVDYHWPSGTYQVRVDDLDTELRLRVENFDRNFTPPEMLTVVNANFNNEIGLLGYDLPTRRVKAGEGIPLVLYWQSLRRTTKSYIIFDRLLDANQQPWGGYDRLPKETYPTFLWVPGEVVADGFAVPVDQAAPDGIYQVVIGLYDEADPAATSLPLVENGQPLKATNVTVGPIKIGDPPSGVILTNPTINYPVNVDFGDIIRLLGYDLDMNEQRLKLDLYWKSLNRTERNYTVFVHLLDETDRLIAQGDHPPANGRYPTSLWEAGEIVRGEVEISLAEVPSGRYRLLVGLYDSLTGERLATTTPSTARQDNLTLQIIDK